MANFKPDQNEYKNLTPFKMWLVNQINKWECSNFPFLESDFDKLTNYAMMMKLMKAMNKVISNENKVEEDMTNLFNAFTELQNYVNTYFDTVDFQNMVDNKLDEMVIDGTLEDLLNNKLNLIRVYSTISDMIEDKNHLSDGMNIKTLGYYESNDGGNANFKIVDTSSLDKYQIDLENGLYAELITDNNTINFLSLGAKKQNKENILYDNKEYLDKFMDFVNNSKERYNLYIPAGIYGFSETDIDSRKGFSILGDYSYSQWLWTGTIFVPYENNQNYIIKVGNVENSTLGIEISDITFSTAYYEYDETTNSFKIQSHEGAILEDNLKHLNGYCLDLLHNTFSRYKNLDFHYIIGGCLQISSSWELDFNKINIRKVWNLNNNLINLASNNPSIANANITAININELYAEAIIGTVLNVENGCSFANSRIGLINVEPNRVEFYGDINVNLSDSFTDTYTSVPLININSGSHFNDIDINNIQINNIAWIVTTYNYINYIYDTIIKYGNGKYINPIINNISVVGQRRDVKVLSYNESSTSPYQSITINNIKGNNSTYKLILDVTKIYNININNFENVLLNNKINNGLLQPCYKYNYISPLRIFGDITYDADALTTDKLCLNFINKDTYPTINAIEMKGYLTECENLYLRCKAPNEKSGSLRVNVAKSDGTSIGNKTVTISGDDTFKWYVFDLTALELDFSNEYIFNIYPQSDVDFEILADVFYIK